MYAGIVHVDVGGGGGCLRFCRVCVGSCQISGIEGCGELEFRTELWGLPSPFSVNCHLSDCQQI